MNENILYLFLLRFFLDEVAVSTNLSFILCVYKRIFDKMQDEKNYVYDESNTVFIQIHVYIDFLL